MFIDALCIGLDPLPASENIQFQLREELKEKGIIPLLEELKQKDPIFYETVDHANSKRILRALEVIRITNQSFSSQRQNKPAPRPFTVTQFVIQHPREQLYERINQRVDQMMEQGLLAEAKKLEHLKNYSALQTVGYQEFFDYFDGKISLEMCVEKIKQHTRNYAKRQTTWFKRNPENHWILYSDLETMRSEIIQKIGN